MGAKEAGGGRRTEREEASGGATPAEITSSGVVASRDPGAAAPRPKRPSFRALTPYQARLDVEMDDTAVSKVRDPSVSLRLSRPEALRLTAPARNRGPLASLALGTAAGVLLVLLVAMVVRACAG